MKNCKMILVGRDQSIQFFCERCAVGDVVEVRAARGRPVKKYRVKQPGVCVSCGGSRRDESCTDSSKACPECGGSGVCPECNGEYSRSWNDLSITAQSAVLSRIEHGEDLVGGYQIVNGMYKPYV